MWERRGVERGGGSHLCRAGAAAIATYTPGAPLGAGGSAGRELASARNLGQQRGRPAAACTAASAALGGPGRSEGESESPGAEPGETQLREGARPPAPLSRLLRPSRGAPADRPAGRRAGSTGPRSPRDGLGVGARLAALLPAGARRLLPIAQGCEPRRPGAASRGGPGRRS